MEKPKKGRTMSPEMLEKLAAAREKAAEMRRKKTPEPEPVAEPVAEPVSVPPSEPIPIPPAKTPKLRRQKEIVVVDSDYESSGDEEYVIKIPKRVIKAKRVRNQVAPVRAPEKVLEPEPEKVPEKVVVMEQVKPEEPPVINKPVYSHSQHLVSLARMGYSF
jgi:hypothetical protein